MLLFFILYSLSYTYGGTFQKIQFATAENLALCFQCFQMLAESVRIKLAIRCGITVVFNRASLTLLGAQVYFLCRFLITKFGVLQLIVLINVLNDSDSKTKE